MIEDDEAALVATGKEETAILQGLAEGLQIVGTVPAILHGLFEPARIDILPLGLLPFGEGEIRRVAFRRVFQTARHCPAMFQIKVARQAHELLFEE
ncbi:hypothetical protein [Rhizobium brockwellii]|uniref:hypothetical protein n=1 Tax=Rhizobium brockwellii TaxID=3019932 RepID=UPI003F986A9E